MPVSSPTPVAPTTDGATATTVPSAEEVYRERRDRFGAEADLLTGRSTRLANNRLLLFVAALALAGWAAWSYSWPLGAVAGVLLVGFGVLVARHRGVERERRRCAALRDINSESVARVARDWDALPLRHNVRAEPDHPYGRDLDLFGRASLLHLLEAVGTRPGEDTLARWLAVPAEPATVTERQAAVAELAPRVDWRDDLLRRARSAGGERPEAEPFLTWAEGEQWLTRRPGLLWAARVGPPLFWLLLVAQLVGAIGTPLWLAPFLLNLVLGWRLSGPAAQTLQRVGLLAARFGAYADALDLIATTAVEAPALRCLNAAATAGGISAAEQLRRLHRVIIFAQPPSSLLYALIESTTLWNLHVLAALEGWQDRVGRHARGWLTALGEVEALAAFARLAHDNPDWSFPTLDSSSGVLDARGLGHPLLPGDVRVENDVEIGPRGTFLLVTGSNMAGKSTLLRSVGVNVVLAQAGAPVCAARLRMPPLDLWTSMRVQDSLAGGISFFMAELQRLKAIVDAAEADATTARGRPLLYLLDEILQGTNTAERQIAARRIIRLLLARGALGAVSTHDLTLAEVNDLAAVTHAVHLTETVAEAGSGPAMSFDYRLRPGVARSTNALRLLELVGLPAE